MNTTGGSGPPVPEPIAIGDEPSTRGTDLSARDAPAEAVSGSWIALMYHDVLPRGVSGDYFSVPADRFAQHLEALEAAGYEGTSLAAMASGDRRRAAAITFDDATASQVEQAFPILLEHGMEATFFVVTDWVGRPGYASWEQLRMLKAHGMDVQSHTHTHPFLSELEPHALQLELRRSREILDQQLGQDTRTLALPGGDFPPRSHRGLLARCGYELVATSIFGRNSWQNRGGSGLRYVRRCTVRGDTDPAMIRRVLAGDPLLFTRRRLRETALRNLRRSLGPSRYARWRRRFMQFIQHATPGRSET